MSIQLLFKHATGNIPEDKFWVGFVVRFWDLADSKSIPCCRAVEIISLGLTMAAEKRERDGFSFPVLLQHKKRFDKKVVPRFYVAIEDSKRVFTDCNFIDSVDFVFAAKDGLTMTELAGSTSVTVFSPDHPEGLTLDLFDGHQTAGGVRFALIAYENGVGKFCKAGPVLDIDGYPGDIESYCRKHAAGLDNSGQFPVRPATSVPPASLQPLMLFTQPAPTARSTELPVHVPKGGNVSLTKMAPELTQVSLQLGWNAALVGMELDASAFMLGETGKVRGDSDFIYYGQPASVCSSIVLLIEENLISHQKACLQVDLGCLPRAIKRVVFCVTIYEAETSRQYFSHVHNAFVRIVDACSGRVLCLFNLVDHYNSETGMIFGEIYRYKDEWKFKAVGQGYSGGLAALCGQFGVEVI